MIQQIRDIEERAKDANDRMKDCIGCYGKNADTEPLRNWINKINDISKTEIDNLKNELKKL